MSFLFGSPSKQTSSSNQSSSSSSLSENVNNGMLSSAYGGQIGSGTTANNFLSSLLTGGGDTTAAKSGYNNYLQMAGYQPAMTQLSRNITGQGAAAGMLNSGSTAKAFQDRGATLNNQFFNNYLQQLNGLSQSGLAAGNLLAGTGQRSTSTSTSTGTSTGSGTGESKGILGSIGSAVGGIASIFSDRRLKRDIVRVGEYADGLGKYLYRYAWDMFGDLREGVMADEVAKLRPWALGPKRFGFATVNYGAL